MRHIPRASLTLVHTSDVHIGASDPDRRHEEEGVECLRAVVEAASASGADVLLLAGDTFDHARVDEEMVAEAATILKSAGLEVVILPGNHDCLAATSPLIRPPIAEASALHVLGVESDLVALERHGLEIWGRAHRDHRYMKPLPGPLPPRQLPWRIVTAHGHWCDSARSSAYGWAFDASDLVDLDADYVALGHWDNRHEILDTSVPCHYSGSPTRSGTVNVLTLNDDGSHEIGFRRLERSLAMDPEVL